MVTIVFATLRPTDAAAALFWIVTLKVRVLSILFVPFEGNRNGIDANAASIKRGCVSFDNGVGDGQRRREGSIGLEISDDFDAGTACSFVPIDMKVGKERGSHRYRWKQEATHYPS